MIKQISKFALLVLIAAILYLLISGNMFSSSPFVIVAQVLAIVISVWARRSFQTGKFRVGAEPKNEGLIKSGPYHYIRHPMYAAALLFVWASIMGHISTINMVIGVTIIAVIIFRIGFEEQLLRTKYPDYELYSHTTSRIIPFLI